ncbi:hypothetical protein H3146_04000 [Streptomyces sp. OF3]|uniref:Uncharacterized protein n=1 Tax=Streptomyces alkaliterrae TaxID=2213162 RepID=A0A7W3ZL98_9ACTN|nr:hypothetical protein [Streptomyces alkaliterrae]MBB1252538.1 hypothetical protein [Streptomyces alkaliterrae]
MTIEVVGDLVLAGLAIRVFGSDVKALLRRAAAAGVRIGVGELSRSHAEGREVR